METIIYHLIWYNQYLLKIISQLVCFIVKYISLMQWAHDANHSLKYQKFKPDRIPAMIKFEKRTTAYCLNTTIFYFTVFSYRPKRQKDPCTYNKDAHEPLLPTKEVIICRLPAAYAS